MSYVSLALKHRPQTFEEIIGQPHVAQTLRNAVAAGRVAHAYLFAGPRGTGKTTTARVLAKALSCERGLTPDPCGECDSCVDIRDGSAVDVAEIDAASNRGIDEIRELREKVKYTPASARCKVYILDEVHMLTTEAFNALLKTLEEPPEHAFFVLATTEPHRVPATILSRCQRFDFRQIGLPDIVDRLRGAVEAEETAVSEEALFAVARAARGAMRDGWSILDQVIAFSDGEITVETVHSALGVTDRAALQRAAEVIASDDVAGAYALVSELVAAGKDIEQFLRDLTLYFRDLLVIALGCQETPLLMADAADRDALAEHAQRLGGRRVRIAVEALAAAQAELRQTGQHQLLLEITLARLAHPPRSRAAAAAPAQAAAAPAQTTAAAPAAQPTQQRSSPPPAPPAEPAAADGEVSPEIVQARWGQLEQQFRESARMSVWAVLREGRATEVRRGKLVLVFPADHQFHCEQVRDRFRPEVEQALAAVLGRPVAIECELREAASEDLQPVLSETDVAPAAPAEAQGEASPPAAPEASPTPQGSAAGGADEVENQILRVFPGTRRAD